MSVDGKPAGTHVLAIKTADNGTVTVSADTSVKVRVAIITYSYTFRGTETWKDGRLLALESATNDDGKKHAVAAKADKDGTSVTANGKELLVKGDAWTTLRWQLPADKKRAALTLIDADTGKTAAGKLELVGLEKVSVAGKVLEANHYRLTGGMKADLWYDGLDRLVRQESVEEGHKTVLELTKYRK